MNKGERIARQRRLNNLKGRLMEDDDFLYAQVAVLIEKIADAEEQNEKRVAVKSIAMIVFKVIMVGCAYAAAIYAAKVI